MGINEIRPDVIARGKNSAFEAERYEMTEAPRHHFELQRRDNPYSDWGGPVGGVARARIRQL